VGYCPSGWSVVRIRLVQYEKVRQICLRFMWPVRWAERGGEVIFQQAAAATISSKCVARGMRAMVGRLLLLEASRVRYSSRARSLLPEWVFIDVEPNGPPTRADSRGGRA
jgi:hypothetical protein